MHIFKRPVHRTVVFGTLFLLLGSTPLVSAEGNTHPGSRIVFPIFWTWQDGQIENPELMQRELLDIKQAGFGGVYCMLRAARYHLFDSEVTAAVKTASRLCQENGLEFVWGADPRIAAAFIVRRTGYGADMLMVNREFQPRLDVPEGKDPETHLLNETKVVDGRYSLRYQYPVRRDLHMLTEVSLWLNPLVVEKVYAFQRINGKVVRSSIRDITPSHHLFVNRAFNYAEVFGRIDLPEGEWFVFAFPRFKTNMYAYDSPEHEAMFLGLVDRYKEEGIRFDGFWWDEPGYYFQFGHYAISSFIYQDFLKKYGYDLRENLYALTLNLDDNGHIRVRWDYFNLLMDYVYGGEKRFWLKGESLFGPLRMGVHQTWHWLPDDAFAGVGDVWRGLPSVDGGYTDEGTFEGYFRADELGRFVQVSRMVVAKSLAKFSRGKKAHLNQWGVQYGDEVPIYWNDLMAAFSNEWINHCYGYTGVLGADRNFGPGFPNHPSWALSAGFNERNHKIKNITQFIPPSAEVAIVYPNPTILTGWAPQTIEMVRNVDRLIGAMPALGIQADAISVDLLALGRLENGVLRIHDQFYKALVMPYAKVVTPACLALLRELKKIGFPVHFINGVPMFTADGRIIQTDFKSIFDFPSDPARFKALIEALNLPSPCTKIDGAFLNVIPGSSPEEVFLTVMPVDPKVPVGGKVTCMGQEVLVDPTGSLAIYKIQKNKGGVVKVF